MAARQRIVRVRREYNQWVANQTLEDYALRFTAKAARRWSSFRVANTALGGISFLALEAIGATITIGYGFTNAVAAIVTVAALIFATSLPISYYAARDGVDIDLLTRGAGFGYIGSTVTSLIYASFTFIFFAIEAVILASMLKAYFGIPPAIGFVLCSVAVVPLVTHGITFISRVQLWSQPLWIVLQLLPFAVIALRVSVPSKPGRITPGQRRRRTGASTWCCSAPPDRLCSHSLRRLASRWTTCATCRHASPAARRPGGGWRCWRVARAGS